jgi:hypothetical protein
MCGSRFRAIRQADLVHTHLVHADVYGALGAPRLVSTKHNDDPFRAGAFRYVERALARRAAKIIAITSALARFQVERVGLPAEKVEVVHYGLDDLPAPWGANERTRWRPMPKCSSRSRASSRRRASTSRCERCRASARVIPRRAGRAGRRAAASRAVGACAGARGAGAPARPRARRRDLASACRAPRPSCALGGIRSRTPRGDARLEARRRDECQLDPGDRVGRRDGIARRPRRSGRTCRSGEPRARRTGRVRRARARTRQSRVQRREDDEPDPRYLRDRSGGTGLRV